MNTQQELTLKKGVCLISALVILTYITALDMFAPSRALHVLIRSLFNFQDFAFLLAAIYRPQLDEVYATLSRLEANFLQLQRKATEKRFRHYRYTK